MSPMKLEDYTSQRLVEPSGAETEGAALLGSPTGGIKLIQNSICNVQIKLKTLKAKIDKLYCIPPEALFPLHKYLMSLGINNSVENNRTHYLPMSLWRLLFHTVGTKILRTLNIWRIILSVLQEVEVIVRVTDRAHLFDSVKKTQGCTAAR